ncbi:hypothetical protein KKI24_28990 [bacterium]|nr:hypothetical protein [bacterium]
MAETYEQFRKVYEEIQKDKAVISRSRLKTRTEVDRHKLLTIGILEDLVRKGDDYTYTYKGVTYTISKAALKGMRENVRGKFNKNGVTFSQLLQKTDSDTKSHSREEIKNAHVVSVKNALLVILTDKSGKSTWRRPKHRCTIELKDFDGWASEPPSTNGSYRVNAQKACKGNVGVYCDCEDFQYRRNYWVTLIKAFITQSADTTTRRKFLFLGKETISNTPKETSFPKITHATGEKGPLCIHLIRAKKELEKPITINRVAQEMVRLANSVEPGAGVGEVEISDEVYKELEKKIGKGKLKQATDAWVDEKAKKAFEPFKKATETFRGIFKKMMSKEIKKREKIEGANKKMAKELLRLNQPAKKVSELSGLDIKEVEKLAKELK